MTPAEQEIVVACCARAAELWAAGRTDDAARWIDAALGVLNGRDFVDLEQATTPEDRRRD